MGTPVIGYTWHPRSYHKLAEASHTQRKTCLWEWPSPKPTSQSRWWQLRVESLCESFGVTRRESWEGWGLVCINTRLGYSGHFAKPQKGELQGWTCYQKKPPGDRAFHSSPGRVDPDLYDLTLLCAGPIPGLRRARMTGETQRQSYSLFVHGEPAKFLTTS